MDKQSTKNEHWFNEFIPTLSKNCGETMQPTIPVNWHNQNKYDY